MQCLLLMKIPNHHKILCIHRKLPQSASFYRWDVSSEGYRRIPSVEEAVLRTVEDNPATRTRAVTRALDLSHSTALRTLNDMEMYPHHLQRVQNFTPEDYHMSIYFA